MIRFKPGMKVVKVNKQGMLKLELRNVHFTSYGSEFNLKNKFYTHMK